MRRRQTAAVAETRARRRAAGMPHHPVRCRPGLPSQGSPPLPTTSVEHNITKVVEVHTLLYNVHKVLLIFHCEAKSGAKSGA
jgi:hypothetical protein